MLAIKLQWTIIAKPVFSSNVHFIKIVLCLKFLLWTFENSNCFNKLHWTAIKSSTEVAFWIKQCPHFLIRHAKNELNHYIITIFSDIDRGVVMFLKLDGPKHLKLIWALFVFKSVCVGNPNFTFAWVKNGGS